MGNEIKLTASDGFQLGGYRADPAGGAKAAVVVIQEIFGVNHHIRAVCDRFAAEGYVAIAPAIFDRIEPDFQSGYSPDEVTVARKFVANPDWDAMLRDTQPDTALRPDPIDDLRRTTRDAFKKWRHKPDVKLKRLRLKPANKNKRD